MSKMPTNRLQSNAGHPGATILVVADRSEPVASVRQRSKSWAVAPHVEWARDAAHAMQIALLIQPHIILLDARLEFGKPLAMEKRLARWCTKADIYTFIDRETDSGFGRLERTVKQLHWDQLPTLLSAWGQLHSKTVSAPAIPDLTELADPASKPGPAAPPFASARRTEAAYSPP